MDSVLLHIGYHKTASTWLQQTLFSPGSPVFEPMSLDGKGKTRVARNFFCDREGYLLSPFDDNEEAIKAELDSIQGKNLRLASRIPVISHERLSGNPHCGGFDARKIAKMLHASFPDGKVLIVIREQRSFLLSNYFQYLSVGGTHSLKKYLQTKYDHKRPTFSPHHVNYLGLVNTYFELFGPQRVLVLPYEMFRATPMDFVDRIGVFVDKEIQFDPGQLAKKVNYKPDKFAMYHLRWLNVFRKSTSLNDYSVFSNRITKKISEALFVLLNSAIPGAMDERLLERLKVDIREWVGDRYVDANRQLGRAIGIDLGSFDYYR